MPPTRRAPPIGASVLAGALALLGLASGASTARAQESGPSAANREAAEQLFEAARRDLRAGRTAEACPKLAESQRLDAGLGTLLHLGECYERLDRTASAWTAFREAIPLARANGDAPRERLAQERADALLPRLARVMVEVYGTRPAGLVLWLDDAPLAEARWGVAMPLDPGLHRVRARAPAHHERTFDVIAEATKTSKLTISPLLPEASAPSAPLAEPPPTSPPKAPPALSTPRHRWTTTTIVGATSSGVAIAAGGIFGVRALRAWNASRAYCDADNACDPPGLEAIERAKSSATLATALFATGIVLGATTAVLVWSSSPTRPHVAVGPTSLSLSLRWP